MKTITLKIEDYDDVIIDDLIDSYHMNNRFDRVDCSDTILEPDYKLLEAILTVLEYYMIREDFEEFVRNNPIVRSLC